MVAGADDGERLRFSGAEFVIRASAETTGGALGIIEVFYVLEGEHVFRVGDREHRVGPGGAVFGPRGVPHAQRRVVPRQGRILAIVTPAGLEGFFRDLAAAEAAGTIGPDAYAEVAERYGITWL